MHTLVWRLSRAVNRDIEVAQVIFMGNCVDTGDPKRREN